MIDNRCASTVATAMGFLKGEPGKVDFKAAFKKARVIIKQIERGECDTDVTKKLQILVDPLIRAVNSFDRDVHFIEEDMKEMASRLPIAKWVMEPERAGFRMLSLATLIGECGNLSNYSNPGKVWRRMGLAPFESDGVVHMGCEWKKIGLSKMEWSEYGYSPRRRAVAFTFGDNIVRSNWMKAVVRGSEVESVLDGQPDEEVFCDVGVTGDEDEGCTADGFDDSGDVADETALTFASSSKNRIPGPYRRRYDEVRASVLVKNPDWLVCRACRGSGKVNGRKCGLCKGTGETAQQAHRHAMLLATKMLIKEAWIAWNPERNNGGWRAGR